MCMLYCDTLMFRGVVFVLFMCVGTKPKPNFLGLTLACPLFRVELLIVSFSIIILYVK